MLADAGIEVVLSGVRMSRMNSIMERWIQACRHEPARPDRDPQSSASSASPA